MGLKQLMRRAAGPMVPPDPRVLSTVYHDPRQGTVGPGGGYGWGAGPRTFVGSSKGLDTQTLIGAPGDFPVGGPPLTPDNGFPTASRWPGWPGGWQPPFYEAGTTSAGGPGQPFMGGVSLVGRVSTVFACTDLISRSLATMGLKVMQGGTPIAPPPWVENPEPEIYTSLVDAMQCCVNSILHRGEAFIVPTARYADGTVARWVVLNPDYVEVEAGVGGLPLYSVGGISIDRPDILHIKYQAWPGTVRGVGPMEACWRNLLSAEAMQRWGTMLAVQNGIPIAVLQSEAKLTADQANAIKLSWAEASATRGALPAVLSGGLTFTPLNLSPADVGLLDLRMFDEQRIASCFGVPLWLVGLPVNDGLTYSTVEDTFDYFWRATLRPIAYNIACALGNWALARGSYLRFSSEQLIEPSVGQRATIYATLIGAGVITPTEARLMEHLPPSPPEDAELLGNIRNPGV
jgi:HK97 family phage portal protein